MSYALYSKEQLAIERSKGLSLSDNDNDNFYAPTNGNQSYNWDNNQFEQWLSTKSWTEEMKNKHRAMFSGYIEFDGNGGFFYEQ